MFSIADMAVAGAVALLLFGPDQLPKVARRAGQLVRDVQNTSQSFIREMERAADATPDVHAAASLPVFPAAPAYHETPVPAAHELATHEPATHERLTHSAETLASDQPAIDRNAHHEPGPASP